MTMAEKLLEMQKQLLEITSLPLQIRETIALVTKALEQYIPNGTESEKSESKSRETSWEKENESNGQYIEEQEQDPEFEDQIQYNGFEEISEEQEINEDHNKNQEKEEVLEPIEDPEEVYRHQLEQAEIEMMKRQKQQKIQTLERSWQKLCETEKKIHKISQLNQGQLISFYDRKRSPTMDRN